MPDNDMSNRMNDFCENLSEGLTVDSNHPKALFLGRVTGDAYTQKIWYVYNPEIANDYLQTLIKQGDYPMDFCFKMDNDSEWEEAHCWLDQIIEK